MNLNGFGERIGVLILVMSDWVISYQIKSKRLERLWYNRDRYTHLQDIYAYEMNLPLALLLFKCRSVFLYIM